MTDGKGNNAIDMAWHEAAEVATFTDLASAALPAISTACGLVSLRLRGALLLICSKVDVLALNRVISLGVSEPATSSLIDDIVARYRDAGARRMFVSVAPGARPASLPELLLERGFRHYNNWVTLGRDAGSPPGSHTDLRIAQIGAEHATAFGALAARCFDWPDAVAAWVALSVGRRGWRHYMAFDSDLPVASGSITMFGDTAWFGFGATDPAFRGRGAQSALLARRIADASILGCRRLTLETAEPRADRPVPSLHNVTRSGFRETYRRPNYLLDLTA